MKFTATARSLGIISSATTFILLFAYAVTLTVGLLFISIMPAMVALMVAMPPSWASWRRKGIGLALIASLNEFSLYHTFLA